jgi:hypothetical protein
MLNSDGAKAFAVVVGEALWWTATLDAFSGRGSVTRASGRFVTLIQTGNVWLDSSTPGTSTRMS